MNAERPVVLVPFNINGYIRVRFSPASLRLWRERAEGIRQRNPILADRLPLEPPTDERGFYRGRFWSIMHLVASELQAGRSAFEDCLIELETPAPPSGERDEF